MEGTLLVPLYFRGPGCETLCTTLLELRCEWLGCVWFRGREGQNGTVPILEAFGWESGGMGSSPYRYIPPICGMTPSLQIERTGSS